MGRPSRDKGARGEREVCAAFTAAGIPVVRTPNSGGLHVKGDVLGVPEFHVEVKRRETFDLPGWLRQAHGEADGAHPAVIFRRSAAARVNDPAGSWHVAIPLPVFLYLLRNQASPIRNLTVDVTPSTVPWGEGVERIGVGPSP